MSTGLAVIVTVRTFPSRLRKQVALLPQLMSDTVWLFGAAHDAGGPACELGGPQSPSVTRIRAGDESCTTSLKVTTNLSFASSVPVVPTSDWRTADVEVGVVPDAAPKTVASSCFE